MIHFVSSLANLEFLSPRVAVKNGVVTAGVDAGTGTLVGLGAKEVGRLRPLIPLLAAIRDTGAIVIGASSALFAWDSGQGIDPCGSFRRTPSISLVIGNPEKGVPTLSGD